MRFSALRGVSSKAPPEMASGSLSAGQTTADTGNRGHSQPETHATADTGAELLYTPAAPYFRGHRQPVTQTTADTGNQ